MNKALVKEFALSVLYPKRCRFCDRVIDFRLPMCKKCISELDTVSEDACLLCGAPKKECECKKHSRYYTCIVAPYYYGGTGGAAVRRLKFDGIKDMAVKLGDDMAECLLRKLGDMEFDMIADVPMSVTEEKARGFNQSKLLAQRVSEVTGIPYAELLQKDFETLRQRNLSRDERSGNVLGCFSVTGSADLTGLNILLCDDIITTGSTLDECAKTLRIAGAQSVTVICAAVTRPPRHDKTSDENAENGSKEQVEGTDDF